MFLIFPSERCFQALLCDGWGSRARAVRRLCCSVLLCCTLLSAGRLAAEEMGAVEQAQLPLPRTTLEIRTHRVQAELATTPSVRQRGLMYRSTLEASQGMLFVFPQPDRRCFWMKNTLIALDAAFIDTDGRITRIAQMQPLDETAHCSTKAVGYVLEVSHGWFNKRRIKEGDRVQHLPPLTVAQ